MQKKGINVKNSQKHVQVQLYLMEINGDNTSYLNCVTLVFSADAPQSMSNALFDIISIFLIVTCKPNMFFGLQILLSYIFCA